MRSGCSSGSIFWVLLVSGRFSVSKTIIPEHGSTFLPIQYADTVISSVDWGLELWDEEPSLSAGKSVTMRFRLNADLDWVLKGTVREVEQHRVLIEGDALLAPAGRD